MNFLMDTANLDSIRYGVEYFPGIGVTTNPTLITREEVPDPAAHIAAIREIIGPDRQLHVQLTETEEEQMLAEAEAIVALTGKNTYLKVPVSPLGLRVTRALSEQTSPSRRIRDSTGSRSQAVTTTMEEKLV